MPNSQADLREWAFRGVQPPVDRPHIEPIRQRIARVRVAQQAAERANLLERAATCRRFGYSASADALERRASGMGCDSGEY